MATQPKVMHIVTSFQQGGVMAGMHTLIDHGFYNGSDLRVVGLVHGKGTDFDLLNRKLGPEHVKVLLPATKKWPGPLDAPRLVLGLHGEVSSFRPNAIVLSSAHAMFLGRIVAAAHPDVRVISFEHTAVNRSRVAAALFKFTSKKSDVVFGDAPETLVATRRYYRREQPRHEVPLAIVEPALPHQTAVTSHFKLFSLGRLEPQKNYVELIRAVGMLAREGRNLELTIGGEGNLRPILEKEVARLKLADRVKLPGHISDKRPYFESSHIYVQPSCYEGQCIATAEAMAKGKVVVATDFAGSRDYGRDGENMLIIKGYKAENIAARLRDAMDNYGVIAAPMSKAAVETARAKFSQEGIQTKWAKAAAEITRRDPSFSVREAPGLAQHLVRLLLKSHTHASHSPSGAR